MAIFDCADRVALYVHLRSFESDFDKSQSQMRALSSAWSTAVLAAIAVIITTAATPIVEPLGAKLLPVGVVDDRTEVLAYLRAIICFVGSAGVYAFWYIDQGVYQRLLHSVFAYGLFVESSDTKLPQIRSSMFLANLDVTNRLGTFYRAQFWLFAVISVLVDVLGRGAGHKSANAPLEVWYIIGFHALAVLVCDLVSAHTWPSLEDTLANFYPDMLKTLPVRHKSKVGVKSLLTKLCTKPVQPDTPIRNPPLSKSDNPDDPKLAAFLKRIRHQS